MAEDGRQNLRDASVGRDIYESRLQELRRGARTEVDNIVRFLRQIPADDTRKKKELARYFETEDGQRYDAADRKIAYDELLGKSRNRDHIG